MAYRTLSNLSIGSELSAEAEPFDPVSPMRWAHQEFIRSEKREWMLQQYPTYYPAVCADALRTVGQPRRVTEEAFPTMWTHHHINKFYTHLAFADPLVHRETEDPAPTLKELADAERDFKYWLLIREQKRACEREREREHARASVCV